MFSSSIKKDDDNRYCVKLPFRTDPEQIPNNRKLAETRLRMLKHKLSSDDNLHNCYTKCIEDYIVNGYAQKLDEHEIYDSNHGVWYIPHHAVTNPKKPGKVRVVFDCSAKYKETSLNETLHQGPDIVNSLDRRIIAFSRKFRRAGCRCRSNVSSS